MKSTFEKNLNEAVFREALNNEEWNAEIENAYNRTKGKYKVPGFRPGKAPRRFIEMHYGAGVFFDAAVDMCINRVYREELNKHPELEVFSPKFRSRKRRKARRLRLRLKSRSIPK